METRWQQKLHAGARSSFDEVRLFLNIQTECGYSNFVATDFRNIVDRKSKDDNYNKTIYIVLFI